MGKMKYLSFSPTVSQKYNKYLIMILYSSLNSNKLLSTNYASLNVSKEHPN